MDINVSTTEGDRSGLQRVERVVLATTDKVAGLEVRTALANDDGPRLGELAAIELDPAELRVGIASILGGTLSLFMCHQCTPDLQPRMGRSGPF